MALFTVSSVVDSVTIFETSTPLAGYGAQLRGGVGNCWIVLGFELRHLLRNCAVVRGIPRRGVRGFRLERGVGYGGPIPLSECCTVEPAVGGVIYPEVRPFVTGPLGEIFRQDIDRGKSDSGPCYQGLFWFPQESSTLVNEGSDGHSYPDGCSRCRQSR